MLSFETPTTPELYGGTFSEKAAFSTASAQHAYVARKSSAEAIVSSGNKTLKFLKNAAV